MNDYITVRQFAESVGVSVQRIYQRIDSDLKPYLKTRRKYIRISY